MACNNIQNNGKIDQSAEILQFLNDICMNDEHSDVTFIVEHTKIPAHKVVLAGRSSYFHCLFHGNFAEAKQAEIELKVPLEAFKAILKYIYTGCASIVALETHQIIEFYDLAEQYGFDLLKKNILEYLPVNLTLDNCISFLKAAHLCSFDDMQIACMKFMDFHSIDLLDHDTFEELSLTSVCSLLKRNTFYAPEVDIFKAICNWSTNNPGADVKEALSAVRWSELSSNDIFNVVLPSNILEQTELLQVINKNRESSNTSSRIQCQTPNFEKEIDVNLATAEYGAKVISGENPSALLSGNFTDYDWDRGCTYHAISEIDIFGLTTYNSLNSPIIVDLGKVRIINHIKFLLMDRDSRIYSYYIDISVDNEVYTRLFDHTRYGFRSWQDLYFQSCPVRYIKLVGTQGFHIQRFRQGRIKNFDYGYKSKNYDSFDVVGLQAMHTTINYPEMVVGVIKPKKNVAKVEFGVIVEGGGGEFNMLNENPNEFTCHVKGGSIILQFDKPYHIGSLRMLLGNNNNHSNKYSFCIETSMNKLNWEMAIDKRNETLSGWQNFDFVPRPVFFIRIKGTQSNFICTYFECPREPEKPEVATGAKNEPKYRPNVPDLTPNPARAGLISKIFARIPKKKNRAEHRNLKRKRDEATN